MGISYFSPFWRDPRRILSTFAAITILFPFVGRCGETIPYPHIPFTSTPIEIDGDASDWKGEWLEFELTNLINDTAKIPKKDFHPRIHLAWNDDGLLCFISVLDDKIVPTDRRDRPQNADGLTFAVADVNNNDRVNALEAAAYFKDGESCVFEMWRFRDDKDVMSKLKVAMKKTDTGYDIEALIPWKTFRMKDIPPKKGDRVSLQIIVRDADTPAERGRPAKKTWLMQKFFYNCPWRFTRTVELSDKASAHPDAYASLQYRDGGLKLDIRAAPALAGKKYSLEIGGETVAEGTLEDGGVEAFAKGVPVRLPEKALKEGEFVPRPAIDGETIRILVTTDYKPASLPLEVDPVKTDNGKWTIGFDLGKPPSDCILSSPEISYILLDTDTGKIVKAGETPLSNKLELDIPEKGNHRLEATIFDPLPIAGAAIIFKDGKIVRPKKLRDKPPTIVIPIMLDGRNETNQACFVNTLNTMIGSSLVKRYECVVLNRASALDLKTERDIGAARAVEKGSATTTGVPVADYVVRLRSKKNRTKNPLIWDDVKGFIYPLRDATESSKEFSTPIPYIDVIADIIAQNLGLRKRVENRDGAPHTEGKQKWAVLPFFNLADRSIFLGQAGIDKESPIVVEMALKEMDGSPDLVDHKEINKILNEITMAAGNVSFASMSSIARIAKADRALLVNISSISVCLSERSLRRVDVLSVDPLTNAVIDSESAISWYFDTADTAARLAKKIVRRNRPSIPLEPAPLPLREKEAMLLFEDLYSSSNYRYYPPTWAIYVLRQSDAAYALAPDSPKITTNILKFLFHNTRMATRASASQKKRFAHLVRQLAISAPRDSLDADPETLETRFKIAAGGEKARFEALKDNYIPKSWSEQWRFRTAIVRLLESYIKRKEYDKALKLLEQVKFKNALPLVHIRLYEGMGKPEKLLDYMENEFDRGLAYRLFPRKRSGLVRIEEAAGRYLRLIRKLRGPEYAYDMAFKKLTPAAFSCPWTAFEIGKILSAIGDEEYMGKAKLCLESVNNPGSIEHIAALERRKPDEIKKEIEEALAAIKGKYDPKYAKYYKCRDVNPTPKDLKVYFQPVGVKAPDKFKKAAKLLSDYYGTEFVVLDNIPLPENKSKFFIKKTGRYSQLAVMDYGYAKTTLRDDALLFIIVTDLECVTHDKEMRYVHNQLNWGCAKKGRGIIYQSPLAGNNPQTIAKSQVRFIEFLISKLYAHQGLERRNFMGISFIPQDIFADLGDFARLEFGRVKLGMSWGSVQHYKDETDFNIVKKGMDAMMEEIKSKRSDK